MQISETKAAKKKWTGTFKCYIENDLNQSHFTDGRCYPVDTT